MLRALATATPVDFSNVARHFIKRWGKALGAETITEVLDESNAEFRTMLRGLYIRGFEEPRALLLSPFFPSTRASVSERLRTFSHGDPPLLLCASQTQFDEMATLLPKGRAALLSPQAISIVLAGSPEGNRAALRLAIRQQMPLLRLQPYDTTRPVSGEMFMGRRHEMNLLLHQERDSFLITGPSKIGKTSLLQNYRQTLLREGDPRSARSFYVNLQPCQGVDEDYIAHYLAVSFRELPFVTGELKFRDLRSFLFNVTASLGPIEIIVDEADAVCHTGLSLLVTLAEFASASCSRLIVIGRGEVRLHQRRHFATSLGRLRDLRLSAFSSDEAWELFAKPIESLGFRFDAPDVIRKNFIQQTSRMPHLIQDCARMLIESAVKRDTDVITLAMLRGSHDSFLDFGVLRTYLDDLRSPLSRLAAIEMLGHFRPGEYAVEQIQRAFKEMGIEVDASGASDLCDDLVTNCLLTWDKAGYGPPRWDIYESAQRHAQYLSSLKEECLSKIRGLNG